MIEWAAGVAGASPPSWAARIVYAERFGVEPHTVNPPVRWWVRLSEFDRAKNQRRVREAVDAHGLEHQNEDDRRTYNDLILRVTGRG